MRFRSLAALALTPLFVLAPMAFVYATDTNTNTNTAVTLINPLQGGGNLESFLLGILDFVIRIGAIVVVLMVVYVGYKFVTAQGNESKISEARTMLLWTVVGALILLGAKAIALAIQATAQSLGG